MGMSKRMREAAGISVTKFACDLFDRQSRTKKPSRLFHAQVSEPPARRDAESSLKVAIEMLSADTGFPGEGSNPISRPSGASVPILNPIEAAAHLAKFLV